MDAEPALPGYPPDSVRRLVDEPPKRSGRSAFERDRARVLHAASLRRLAAKTQVVGPGTDDFVRNRLTHSLEVGQVARELGKAVGCDPDLVETAALAHDLGHPPFGHNGERVLDDFTEAAGGFEGNAQTLRILTRLEAKTATPDGRSVGLNLTRATLDACVKYPWTRADAPEPTAPHSDDSGATGRKFGVYADDEPVFGWVRLGVAGHRRCIEAQVMDLSDDIAYCVHDVEDAVVAGSVELVRLDDPEQRAAVFATVRDWYLPAHDDERLAAALERLRALPLWPTAGFDGSRLSLAGLKQMTSGLIGRFSEAAQQSTHEAFGAEALTRHRADLVVPPQTSEEIAVLKGIAAHYVMRAHDRVPLLDRQRAVLAELVAALVERAPAHLEVPFAADWAAAPDDFARLRVVVDQVASLTDVSAGAWHARLT